MIDEKKLKEAVEILRKEYPKNTEYGMTNRISARLTLLDLAEQVLKVEGLTPENIHQWYLDATKELNPESYNPNAQKKYEDLTEEQKFIDKYIVTQCKLIVAKEYIHKSRLLGKEEIAEIIDQVYDCDHNGSNYVANWDSVADAIINRQMEKMEGKK